MSKLSPKFQRLGCSLRASALVLSAAALASCVAQVRVAGPPPPAVYVAPAAVDLQVREAPPPLPDYDQPPCPEDGYLWTPGYWAWGAGGYYWVPGTWVQPPRVGVLWTPGYWGFVGGAYVFHAGYWGPHVGFYGGVNYGFGYVGTGFAGGVWVGNAFSYNRAVTNINVTVVHNTYNTTVVNNVTVNRVSYNGGAGTSATPTGQEQAAAREQHVPPTPMQQQHLQQAAKNPALFAHANGGHPPIAATPRPTAFNAPDAVAAHGRGPQENRPQFARQEASQTPAPKPNQAQKQNPNPKKKKNQKDKPHPKKQKDEANR
ncbi:MAG TPA: YXWGXW repeat-containing protein [Steroidobacteraceae bacterium]|nr:YXWGXW repeat-containing protein [Steroidobacteraceae bacterium]